MRAFTRRWSAGWQNLQLTMRRENNPLQLPSLCFRVLLRSLPKIFLIRTIFQPNRLRYHLQTGIKKEDRQLKQGIETGLLSEKPVALACP